MDGLPGYDRLIVPGRISSHIRRQITVTDSRIQFWDRWLTEAEAQAGLTKLDGGLWHAYRRKWATERKELPLQ